LILPVATFFIVEAINCCHKFIEPFHFSDLKMNFESAFGIVFTALLWGITDPLLKKFGTGFNERSPDSGNYGFVGFSFIKNGQFCDKAIHKIDCDNSVTDVRRCACDELSQICDNFCHRSVFGRTKAERENIIWPNPYCFRSYFTSLLEERG